MLSRQGYLLLVAHKDAVKRAKMRVERVMSEPYDRQKLAEALNALKYEEDELRHTLEEVR